jgi:hypothetical protein
VKFEYEHTELSSIRTHVNLGSVLKALLYLLLLYTTDLPTSKECTTATFAKDTATFAKDTAKLATDSDRHCFTEAANQPRRNTKMVKEFEHKS